MEKVAGNREHERPVVIPLIVGIVVVSVHPSTSAEAVGVEHVRIANGVSNI
jgi:hypothetical protein